MRASSNPYPSLTSSLVAATFLIGMLGVVRSASAGPISLTTSGVVYNQNFDTLYSAVNGTVVNSPANRELSQVVWNSAGTGSMAGGTSGSGWWQNGQTWVRAADGSNGAGGDNNDATSWGADGSTERAFGLGSSTSSTASIGAFFTNNIGGTINQLNISFTGEQWREGVKNGTRLADTLVFEYSVDATSLTSGIWTEVPALDFKSLQTNAVNFGPLDGNDPANQQALTASITGLTIANNATLFLRWRSANNATGNDGLGIDNFSLTPVTGGGNSNPLIVSITPVGGGAFQITGTGPVNESYHILATDNLGLPVSSWIQIGTGTFTGGVFQFTDPDATNFSRRFYGLSIP